MHTSGLLAHARARQRTAHALIGTLGLLELLRPVGTPVVIGSVRTGLMYDPDIDVAIHAPSAPDIAVCFDALRALALRDDIVEVVFFENKLRKPFTGLYIDLGCRFLGAAWQVNISVLGADCPHRTAMEETADAIVAALDAPTRHTILTIKAERMQRFGSWHDGDSERMAESIDLYRAVFEGGVKTYNEAVAWIARHPHPEPFQPYRPHRSGHLA
jgi:hypothetical protein